MGKSLLFLVGGLTIVTGIIQVRNNDRMDVIPERSSLYYQEQQARNLAKSMIDNAIETMKDDNNWAGSIDIENVVNIGSLGGVLVDEQGVIGGLLGGGGDVVDNVLDNAVEIGGELNSYTMSSSNIPADNSVGTWDQYKLLLVSTSTYDGLEVETEVLMQRDSFSKYSYMTDSELSSSGGNIWFMGADNIYGPIHTNGTFKMSGSPTFYGLTTSPNMWQGHSTNPTSPNFYGGENFNAPTKESPSSYELSKLSTAATSGGLKFTNQIEVLFFESGGEGHANIREYNGSSWSGWTDYNLSSTNGIISTTGRADVSGVVKGPITLHSETLIEIDGDITYVTSPLADSTSTDILGLVSEGDVKIDQNAHSASGSADIDIHASIMALNTSFYVENYSSGGVKGTINLLGGIVQKNRGPVGTFSGSSMVSGYAKNYQYDTRLRATIPPSFPRESIFSIVYWKDKVISN